MMASYNALQRREEKSMKDGKRKKRSKKRERIAKHSLTKIEKERRAQRRKTNRADEII
jgi:hypothetical protein